MVWIRIDADAPWHDKVLDLPNDSARFGWVKALCLAKQHGREEFRVATLTERLGRHGKYVAAMLRVGLLDDLGDGRVAVHDFTDYQRRAANQERQARHRQRNAENVTEPLPDRDATVTQPSHTGQDRQDNTGQDRTEPPSDAFDAYVFATGRSPKNGAVEWLNRLTAVHGEARVAATIIDQWRDLPKISTLLGRVETNLATRKHKAEKERPRSGYHDGSHPNCLVCAPIRKETNDG